MMNSTIDYIRLARDKVEDHRKAHDAYCAACQYRIDKLSDVEVAEHRELLGDIAASHASYSQSVSALALAVAVADNRK